MEGAGASRVVPPGFRFHPTDEEIIIHYLLKKVKDTRFASLLIGEVDINTSEPWDLPKKAKMGENEWFFFYQKDRKYARGRRTNRATKLGYWKATGKDKEIYKKGKISCLVGMKKTLVFYQGRAPKGERSNWVMHEYRLEGNFSDYNFSNTAKEEWVVCRVFHKKSKNETNDEGVEVAKLIDSPTLPPLTDYSSERSPTFATASQEEFKGNNISLSKLIMSQPVDQNNFSTLNFDPINNLNPSPIFYRHPGSVYPIKEAAHDDDQPADSTNFAPNNYYINITGDEYEAERVCKMGTFSSFNISPSHDDILKPSDEGSMPDLDSLWLWS